MKSSMKNFKFIIQYLGTSYNGWQFQPNCSTIQGEIESAIKKILHKNKQDINLIGSGRTDSGVHAIGQVANIKINTNMSAVDLKNAINANIKNDIFIKDSIEVDLNFNSRFLAKRRCYIYKISNKYSPFINGREWFNDSSINMDLLKECSKLMLGINDFTLLSKANSETDNKICEIYVSKWEIFKNKLTYTIEGNRFLHHMVRYLVGTMLEVSKGKISLNDFLELLENNSNSRKIFKAPAHGLYLKKICYE